MIKIDKIYKSTFFVTMVQLLDFAQIVIQRWKKPGEWVTFEILSFSYDIY